MKMNMLSTYEETGRKGLQAADSPSVVREARVVRAAAKGEPSCEVKVINATAETYVNAEDICYIDSAGRLLTHTPVRAHMKEFQERYFRENKAAQKYKTETQIVLNCKEIALKKAVKMMNEKMCHRCQDRFERWFCRWCQRVTPSVRENTFTDWILLHPGHALHYLGVWTQYDICCKPQPQHTKQESKYNWMRVRRNKQLVKHFSYRHPHEEQNYVSPFTYAFYSNHPACPETFTPSAKVPFFLNPHMPGLKRRFQKELDKLFDRNQPMEQGDEEVLEASAPITTSANITLVDERPTDTTSLHTTSEVYSRDINFDIAEDTWGIKKVLEREYPLTSITWKVSDKRKDKIYAKGVPKLIADESPSMISRQLQFFSFLRAGVKIRVQLNGTKFHCGRLLCYFRPLTWNDDTEENFYSLTCYPHFFLDASLSNSGVIDISFTHLLTHFSQESQTCFTDNINSLGQFKIIVYNPLQAAEKSSQQLNGMIYVSLINPFVHLPTYKINQFSYETGYMQGVETVLKNVTGNLIDSGLGIADKFTGGLVTGVGNAVCSLLGVGDKPTDPMPPKPIANRTISPLCHGAGLDHSTRLGLTPVSQTNSTPEIVGATDCDFNLLTLCQMPSLLDQVEWNATHTQATKLFDMLITPVYLSTNQISYEPTSRYTNYNLTMLAFVSRAFCLWRGSLKLKLQVIATQFHSGRLAIVYDPHGNANVNLVDLVNNKSHNLIIMDIQEQQELVIDIPYFAIRPWLRCDKLRSHVNLVSTGDVTNPSYLDCDISGVLRVFVLNALVHPDNVTDKIEINFFFYAGDNFELSVPNPVSPLSTRTGPTDTEYPNNPRYPWYQKVKTTPSKMYDLIMDLYTTGQKLFNLGLVHQGSNWYTNEAVINSSDVIMYVDNCRALADDMDEFDEQTKLLINSLPMYRKVTPIVMEQGGETFTTTREKEGPAITITSGNNQTQVAPRTLSENAMNMQTLLRRFYPLWISPELTHTNDFTVITVPVTPSFAPSDQFTTISSNTNRRYDVHNLAWFSRLFTYFRGSLRYKVLVNASSSDVYVWHNPVDTKTFHVSSGMTFEHICNELNFASDCAVTQVQQGLEIEIPFFSGFNQLLHSHQSEKPDLRAQNGTLYIAVRNKFKDINVSLFVSTGEDFLFNVLRSPPVVHEPAVYPYGDAETIVKFPELQTSLGHDSSTCQIPGTYRFDRYKDGNFAVGYRPDAPVEQMFTVKEIAKNTFMQTTGAQEIKNEYYQNVAPAVSEIKDAAAQLKDFVEDLQNNTIPSVLGQGKYALKDIDTALNVIHNIEPKLSELLEQLTALTINSNSMIDEWSDVAKDAKEMTGMLNHFMKSILYASLWMNVTTLFTQFSFVSLINVITTSCLLFNVELKQIYNWLIDKIFEGSQPNVHDGLAREQGLEEFLTENLDKVTTALACIATVIYCSVFGGLPSWAQIVKIVKITVEGDQTFEQFKQPKEQGMTEILKNIHFSNLGFKAIGNTFTFFQTWLNKLMSEFLKIDSPEVLLEKEFKDKAARIEKWMDKVAELEDEDFYHLALTDITIHDQFYKLADEGKEFQKWLMKTGVSKNISSIIRDTDKRLHEMIKRINAIRPGHGFRYSPFTIMLDGHSGVGKSNMMHKFSDIIRDELQIPHFNSKYTMPKTEKFLDGYEGQAIIEWDDMLQCPDEDTFVGQFINWRSNADCIINKARVEEKGMHFCSKAIIMSSNNAEIVVKTVRDMNAFRNRINVFFDCKLREGLTPEIMKTMPHDPSFDFVRIDIKRTIDGGERYEVIERNVTFERACEYVRTQFAAWDLKQNQLIDEYMLTHGSMRIPRGVVITDDLEIDVQEENLTEDERDEAWMFYCNWDLAEPTWKERALELFKNAKKQTLGNTKKFYYLAKKRLTRAAATVLDKCKQFYQDHPNFVKVMGVISGLAVSATLLKFVFSFFSQPSLTAEHYNETVKGTPMQKVISEHYTETLKSTPMHKIVTSEHYNETVKVQPNVKVVSEHYTEMMPNLQQHKVVAETSSEVFKSDLKPAKPLVTETNDKVTKIVAQTQGVDDEFSIELARKKLYNSMCVIGYEIQRGEYIYRRHMNAICIGGKIILAPHHFFRTLELHDKFFFVRNNIHVLVEYVPTRLCRIRDKDACLYFMGPAFDSKPSILKHFVQEKYLSLIGRSCSSLLVGTNLDGILLEKAGDANAIAKFTYYNSNGTHSYTQCGWSYDFNTKDGECGSPLILCSKAIPQPERIAGIHVAGYKDQRGGFSTLLTQEMIFEAIETLNSVWGPDVTNTRVPPQVSLEQSKFEKEVKLFPEGNFTYHGVMEPKFCPSQPTKTLLKPTPWQNTIAQITEKPAYLRPFTNSDGVKISPLKKGIDKYGKPTIPFNLSDINTVKDSILKDLLDLKCDMPIKPVNDEIAIFGIPGIRYCDSINMSSSPGWPYQCLENSRGQLGKRYLFDEENKCIKDPLLQENLNKREELAKKGIRFPSIWRDCLKDELRPIEKVESGKTRVFTIAPTDFTLLVRKYFLSFEQAFYKGYSKFFSAVGIDPESYSWTTAYNRLRAYGDKCIAGDFSSFDGTLMPELIWATGELINEWYERRGECSDEDKLVRLTLIDEIIHTYQLVNNCVYKSHQGNPSGNPLTVIVNTIVNAFYMRLAFLEIMKVHDPINAVMSYYKQNVVEEIYGDDNRLVVRDNLIQIYNQLSITDCLARHGITYTNSDKQAATVPWVPLLETTFLKRAYNTKHELSKDIVLPAISKDTIYALTNWFRAFKPDPLNHEHMQEQLQLNMECALNFAFFHGREFYNKFYRELENVFMTHNMKPISRTFDEQLYRFECILHGKSTVSFTGFAWYTPDIQNSEGFYKDQA